MIKLSALFVALALAISVPAMAETHLKVGDKAPNFTLPSTHGDSVELASFQGKGNVVLAFYPAAFTGGCTAECKSFHEAGTSTPAERT